MGRATPRALLTYLEGLAEGRFHGASETLAVARMQTYHTMIPRYLPVDPYDDSSLRIANKTGALPGVRADIALLESPNTTVAMAFMTADSADTGFTFMNEGEQCIGQLAKIAFDAWMGGTER
jgi:hypothetical protein